MAGDRVIAECRMVAEIRDDRFPCRSHHGGKHHFAAHWPACQAPFCKLPLRHAGLHDIPAGQARLVTDFNPRLRELVRLSRTELITRWLLTFAISSSGTPLSAGHLSNDRLMSALLEASER